MIDSSLKVVATQQRVYLVSKEGQSVQTIDYPRITQLLVSKSQANLCVLRFDGQDQLINTVNRAQLIMHLVKVCQEREDANMTTKNIYRVNVPSRT